MRKYRVTTQKTYIFSRIPAFLAPATLFCLFAAGVCCIRPEKDDDLRGQLSIPRAPIEVTGNSDSSHPGPNTPPRTRPGKPGTSRRLASAQPKPDPGDRDSTGAFRKSSSAGNTNQDELDRYGRWRRYRTHRFDKNLTAEQKELVEQLEALGYVSGSKEAPAIVNVVVHDRENAYEGLNLYTSGHAPEAILMDMNGSILHKWAYDFADIWPDYPLSNSERQGKADRGTHFWHRARLLENGDLLAIYNSYGIVKLDKDSNLIWANPNRAHHDIDVAANGDIYLLTREARVVPRVDPRKPILEDFITVLDADGQEKKRVSLLTCFENSTDLEFIWLQRPRRVGDIFHTNTIKVLDGHIADRMPLFRKGNILTSMRHLDAIAVVNMEDEEVVWARKGCFREQHDPRILDNGHLLLFDNNGLAGKSRVIEYDPVTMNIHWIYHGTPEHPFWSSSCGTSQRLPNGNTLITESANGRAFEVSPDKTIVWEFCSPFRAGEHDEFIATLFEMLRLPREFPIEWAHSPAVGTQACG